MEKFYKSFKSIRWRPITKFIQKKVKNLERNLISKRIDEYFDDKILIKAKKIKID